MTLSPRTEQLLRDAGLDPGAVKLVVDQALREDLADGPDVTTMATVPATHTSVARFVTRAGGVVAGGPVAVAVLDRQLAGDLDVDLVTRDGDLVRRGQSVLTVRGATRGILTAERTALNLLSQLSGVATATRQWVDAIAGTGVAIRDTRKTVPGLRALQKYAVRCGGGLNHRMSLSDAALVKDNHVIAAGGVAAAFAAVRSRRPTIEIEVECETVEQVRQAVTAGAALILLDNMSCAEMRLAVTAAREIGDVRIEASGGLTLAGARDAAETGVDYLAVGALTHSAPALDIGLDLDGVAADDTS